MRDYIIEQLEAFKRKNARAYKLAIVNWGGTFSCLKIEDYLNDTEGKLDRSALLNERGEFDQDALWKKKDELTPVQRKSELEEILLETLGFKKMIRSGLLEINIIYHKPQDSSQMLDHHREPVLRILQQEYQNYDGFLGLHGTDTVAKTARFLNLNLPHYDPKERWENNSSITNWTKPFGIVASQEPVALFEEGKFIPNVGSDGAMSLITALSVLTSDRFGEVGFLIGREFVYRGTSTTKGSESHFDFLVGDRGVPALAERTAFGMSFPGVPFDERSMFQDRSPYVIHGSSTYEDRVLTVREITHLSSIKSYLENDSANDQTKQDLQKTILRVILYVSKGAGNVQQDEYNTIKQFIDEKKQDVYVLRVPLPGGRVPDAMHYNVPGGLFAGCNIEAETAKQKAQSVLALMDQIGVEETKRGEFFYTMMKTPFGRERLPNH